MDLRAEAEQALIGSIILSPDKIVHIADTVKAEDFSNQKAQVAFISAMNTWRSKGHVDVVSVCKDNPGIATYVAEATGKGSGFGLREEAKQVATMAKEQRVSDGVSAILNSGDKIEVKLDSILSLYQKEVTVSSKPGKISDVLKRFNKQVQKNKKLKRLGYPTGFNFLENNFIQYVPGHIWIMGGFTSVGKTAMMVQKICNLLPLDKCPTMIVISTEMTEEQVVSRILGNLTGVHPFRILSGNFRHGEEEFVEEMKGLINDKPLMVFDDIYEISAIETVFRKADLQGGVDMGFIDYVQNCRNSKATSAYQEGSEMAKRLQKLAKDVRCTLICLSQVSNDVGRGNTDQLEYKGAGEWSAVADVGVYLQRKKGDKHAMKYSIKKNRHGKLVEQEFEYKMDFTRLEVVDR